MNIQTKQFIDTVFDDGDWTCLGPYYENKTFPVSTLKLENSEYVSINAMTKKTTRKITNVTKLRTFLFEMDTDVNGNPIYFEPGDGSPVEYYEGTSVLVSIHIYDDTPIGIGKITILGEAKTYVNEHGATVPVPSSWDNVYNVKWEKEFKINKLLLNEDKVRFYN